MRAEASPAPHGILRRIPEIPLTSYRREVSMIRKETLVLAVVGLAGASCTKSSGSNGQSVSPASPSGPGQVTSPAGATPSPSAIDPANFVGTIDNEWFPLLPGSRYVYRGQKDGETAIDLVTITGETKIIDGVRCLAVRDVLRLGGKLAEKTEDWYVQDRQGNVWYFGEDTAEYNDKGKVVTTEGSWQSGVDGARPGIFMPADPQTGQSFQQEFYPGQAEDHFVVLDMLGTGKVPYGSFKDALVTAEWTPLEPRVLTEKFYVKGIGQVKEIDVAGGDEQTELVSFRKG